MSATVSPHWHPSPSEGVRLLHSQNSGREKGTKSQQRWMWVQDRRWSRRPSQYPSAGRCPRWACWRPWRPSPSLTSSGRRRARREWSTSSPAAGTAACAPWVCPRHGQGECPRRDQGVPPWAPLAATSGYTGQVLPPCTFGDKKPKHLNDSKNIYQPQRLKHFTKREFVSHKIMNSTESGKFIRFSWLWWLPRAPPRPPCCDHTKTLPWLPC